MNVTGIEFVDDGVQGEYGPFGKVVARLDVRGMTEAEIVVAKAEMVAHLGAHVRVREVETVGEVTV